ncbi:hypothetical protein ABT215_11225 [Streptomyces sp900105755]|uniref:hypothetical protein n=1 Tax=Streptomyces sp. 900105755 TaxID=3154389 RepID=UPI00331D4432
MSGNHTDLPRPDQLTLSGIDEAEQQLAARAVHRAARDADDEHELLDALGLLPTTATTRRRKRTTRPTTTAIDAPINTRKQVTT